MEKWWRTSGPVLRISPKFDGLTLKTIEAMLPKIADSGFGVVEIFAPYFGGVEYHGLDGIDFFTVDPAIGTMHDFRDLVAACHARGLRITVFLNLGYTAMNHPAFQRAQRAIRDDRAAPEVDWFIWTDDPSTRFERPLAPWFLQDAHGSWAYSEIAGKYYWCKWYGQQGNVRLPQLNFGNAQWRAECVRIMDTWRETGIDGFIVDAVNWYINCDWAINGECIIDPAFRGGEVYLQPEGAGGFGDDPVPWIEQGRYNSVQDYALNLWWEGNDPLGDAIKSGHAGGLEDKLARYRDRVVRVGGVTYAAIGDFRPATDEERLLEVAFLLAAGEMLFFDYRYFVKEGRLSVDEATRQLLTRQRDTLSLAPAGDRQRVYTSDDASCFAMLRSYGGETMLTVFNFAREPRTVAVYLPGKPALSCALKPLGHEWIKLEKCQQK